MNGKTRDLVTLAKLLTVAVVMLTSHARPGAAQTPAPARAVPAPTEGAIQILVEGAALRVHARDARPADVLEALAACSRVPVTIRGELPGRITRAFAAASFEDAAREVLRGYSVALVLDPEPDRRGAVGAVRIIALPQASRAPAPAAATDVAPIVRLDAVRALARTDHDGADAALTRVLLHDADALVRARAAIGLGALGTLRAAPPLMEALADPSPLVRMQAIRGLGRTDPERAVHDLGAVLSGDPDPGVRRLAARTLGLMKSPRAEAVLESAAGEPDGPVRREIEAALARSIAGRR